MFNRVSNWIVISYELEKRRKYTHIDIQKEIFFSSSSTSLNPHSSQSLQITAFRKEVYM